MNLIDEARVTTENKLLKKELEELITKYDELLKKYKLLKIKYNTLKEVYDDKTNKYH